MTVYLATIGQYDDYRVLGVYTTKEGAEAKLEPYQDYWSYPDVEEFELDE